MKHLLFSGIATVALTLGAARPSEAALMISLSDNIGDSVSVTDQGASDLNPSAGAVTFVGSVGNFVINVTTGLSKPVIGSALYPQIDLSSVDVTSVLGGNLTLKVTDTDFIGSGNPAIFISKIGGTQDIGGTLSYNTFLDCGNAAFGTGTSLSSQTFPNTGAFAGAQATHTTLCSGTYSLTEVVDLTLPGGFKDTSFDANLVLPEPGTVALFGVGLVAFGWLSRRKTAV